MQLGATAALYECTSAMLGGGQASECSLAAEKDEKLQVLDKHNGCIFGVCGG